MGENKIEENPSVNPLLFIQYTSCRRFSSMTGCWCVLLDHGTTRTKSRLGSRLNSSMFWRVTTLSQSSLSTSQTGQKKSSFIPGKAYKNNLDSLIQSLSFTIESSNRFGGHPLSNYAKGRGEGGLKMRNNA